MDLKIKQNWQRLFDQYQKSGMTKADFCRSQGIAQSRFFYYAKYHRESPLADKSNLFVPLAAQKNFTIKINNSVCLSFEAVPDALWMANFVKSLGEEYARI